MIRIYLYDHHVSQPKNHFSETYYTPEQALTESGLVGRYVQGDIFYIEDSDEMKCWIVPQNCNTKGCFNSRRWQKMPSGKLTLLFADLLAKASPVPQPPTIV